MLSKSATVTGILFLTWSRRVNSYSSMSRSRQKFKSFRTFPKISLNSYRLGAVTIEPFKIIKWSKELFKTIIPSILISLLFISVTLTFISSERINMKNKKSKSLEKPTSLEFLPSLSQSKPCSKSLDSWTKSTPWIISMTLLFSFTKSEGRKEKSNRKKTRKVAFPTVRVKYPNSKDSKKSTQSTSNMWWLAESE